MFDPNKARRVGADGTVENIPFTEGPTKGKIFSDLQDLGDLLKGASAEDYDEVFIGAPITLLQRYKHLADQMSMNLKRIIDSGTTNNKE